MRDDSPTWAPGHYEPAVGHYVKYENEFRAASAYATIIHSRADWENGAWMQFDPKSAPLARFPYRAVSRYACQRAYYDRAIILSALRRPGRFARILNFCKSKISALKSILKLF